MTHDQIKAPDKLIAAVEKDMSGPVPHHFDDVFGVSPGNNAIGAYHGSLDASNALHEALLPGWEWWINSKWYWDGNAVPLATVRNSRPTIDLQMCHGKTDNPARAWLIAILKAYRAQMDA